MGHVYTYMKKLTVTIGIPAYNEAKSISKLLDSIRAQKLATAEIKEILVRSDGSTDDTAAIVKQYKKILPPLQLWDAKERIGMSAGLTNIALMSTGDLFIGLDADSTLADSSVLENICREFANPRVGLVSPNVLPHPGRTFIEKLAVTWITFWINTREDYLNGDNVNNHFGCATAMRSEIAHQLTIPDDIIGPHDFIYFFAKKLGYEYRYLSHTRVYYHVASSLPDYLKQTARHHTAKNGIIEHFGPETLISYQVDKTHKFRALVKTFLSEPILFPIACMLQLYLRITQHTYTSESNHGLWAMAASTK